MGFRSTMITEDFNYKIPDWFIEKYPNIRASINCTTEGERCFTFPLFTNNEQKFYSAFEDYDLFKDIQKLVIEYDLSKISLVLLHECEGITKVEIHKDKIVGMEPTSWVKVASVQHSYCYGCSDYDQAKGEIESQSEPVVTFSTEAIEPVEDIEIIKFGLNL